MEKAIIDTEKVFEQDLKGCTGGGRVERSVIRGTRVSKDTVKVPGDNDFQGKGSGQQDQSMETVGANDGSKARIFG